MDSFNHPSDRYYWKTGVRTTKPPVDSDVPSIDANNSTAPASPSPVHDHNSNKKAADMPGPGFSAMRDGPDGHNNIDNSSTSIGDVRPVRYVIEGAPNPVAMAGTIENAANVDNAVEGNAVNDEELIEGAAEASCPVHGAAAAAAAADVMSRLNINDHDEEESGDDKSDEETGECGHHHTNAPCSIHDTEESVFNITAQQNLFRHQAVFGHFNLEEDNTVRISYKGVCALNHPSVNGGRGILFDFAEYVPCFLCFRDIGKPSNMQCPRTSIFVSEVVSRHNQEIMDLHEWECQVCGKRALEMSHLPIPFFNPALGEGSEFCPYIWDYVFPVCRSLGACDEKAEEIALEIIKARFPGRIHVVHSCKACGAPGRLLDCGRCGAVKYCSKPCQVADWPLHKANCRLVQKEAREKQEGKGKDKGKGKKGRGKAKA